MKIETACMWILVVGVFLGVFTPAHITEVVKGGTWTLFKVSGEVDYQVEKANKGVKESDRAWNKKIMLGN